MLAFPGPIPSARRAGVVAAVLGALVGCSAEERPPLLGNDDAGAGASADGGLIVDTGCPEPPALDAGDVCGNLVLPVDVPRRNLYFVVDRSGSMGEKLEGGMYSKYASARSAIGQLLSTIGHRVHYGAAVFPGFTGFDNCATGAEVFPTVAGDPLGASCDGEIGPTLRSLLIELASFSAQAGTPISSTLTSLSPTLKALPGQTWVLLATDGAPNCNADARCEPSECVGNLEGALFDGRVCGVELDCCDPEQVPSSGFFCVDRAATEAVLSDWTAVGIKTFVIGMPGSERYASVLDRFAEAGGTARPEGQRYYSVANLDELTATVLQIGTDIAVSCSISLEQPPPDRNLVNVYFDRKLVPGEDWLWTGPSTLDLRPAACDELRSGAVRQVQVVAGCETIVR